MKPPTLDIDRIDFLNRWKRARLQAIETTLKAKTELDEMSALDMIPDTEHEAALKTVFLNSRKLGRSLVLKTGFVLELDDILSLLADSDVLCLKGSWTEQEGALSLKREPCHSITKSSAFRCLYNKEAIDGLVIGLTDDIRFARHSSATSNRTGHSQSNRSECADVFYLESHPQHAYGEVSQDVSFALEPISSKLNRLGVNLRIDGVSEGTLFYQLIGKKQPLCGPSADMFHQLLRDEFKSKFPCMKIRDASPLAVFSDGNA